LPSGRPLTARPLANTPACTGEAEKHLSGRQALQEIAEARRVVADEKAIFDAV
jgi:hypothetical protein